MSRIEMDHWTCDRCDFTVQNETHKRNGERNGLPVEWVHLDIRGKGASGDLCVACASEYRDWWQQGGGVVRP